MLEKGGKGRQEINNTITVPCQARRAATDSMSVGSGIFHGGNQHKFEG